jgi:hypothetical protein
MTPKRSRSDLLGNGDFRETGALLIEEQGDDIEEQRPPELIIGVTSGTWKHHAEIPPLSADRRLTQPPPPKVSHVDQK